MIQIAAILFSVLSFSMLLEVPWKYAPYSAVVGASGWGCYLAVQSGAASAITAPFLSTLLIAFISHVLARVKKAPVTVFLIPGILPSVPGAAIYRAVSYLIRNDSVLSTRYLVETLQVAGAIAMAVFIVDSFFRLIAYNPSRQDSRS